MHRKKGKQHVLLLLIAVTCWGLAGTVTPVRGQDVICCDIIFIDADGNWFGARRDCKAALAELSAASRAKACAKIRQWKPAEPAPWFKPFSASRSGCCLDAAEVCGDPSMACTTAPAPANRPKLPNKSTCKADNVSLEVSRSSLIQTSSTGNPDPGANPAFKYTANPSSAVTYTTSDPNANPNTGDLKAPPNPNATGEPSPGALAELTVSYTCKGGDTVTKKFSVATFGLSCYRFSVENDFIIPAPPPTPTPTPDPTSTPTSSPTPTPSPTLNCIRYRVSGTRHSGVTTNPPGLPPGDYCAAFLADTRLQGSGITRDGTKIQYVYGSSPWRFTVVTEHRTADGQLPIPGGSVARDRAIIGGRGTTTVKLERGDFVANDTGGAIRGYRLDVFGGMGLNACRNFQNRIEAGACNPGSDKCPELKSPIP